MTQHCGLCDRALPRSQTVAAEINETTTAYVHRTCAEVGGYDYEETPGELPEIAEQAKILTGDGPQAHEPVLDFEIRMEYMGDEWVYTVDDPDADRGKIIASSLPELFEKLTYKLDWMMTRTDQPETQGDDSPA